MSNIRVGSSQAPIEVPQSKHAAKAAPKTQTAEPGFATDSFRIEPQKKNNWSISLNGGHMDKGGKHSGFIGVRTEREIQVLGNEDSRFGLSAIGGHDLKVNSKTFHHAVGLGLKADATLMENAEGDKVSVYLSGSATANVGVISGKTTAGVGLREAAGVQYNNFYAEAFAEQATNYSTQGLAIGARFHLDGNGSSDDNGTPGLWNVSVSGGHLDKGGKHSGFVGLRGEREVNLAGSAESRFQLDAIGASEVKVSGSTFNQSIGVGLKTTVRIQDDVAAYLSGSGTANIGAISGDFTAGVGLREAAGVEYKNFYVEAYAEQATNYSAQGLAVGARLKF